MRKLLVPLCLLGVVLAIPAASSERGKWRLQILAWKATGNLPVMSWPEVVRGLFRCDAEPCIDKIARSEVTIAEFDADNPCPVLWNTPLGSAAGHREHVAVVSGGMQDAIAFRHIAGSPVERIPDR